MAPDPAITRLEVRQAKEREAKLAQLAVALELAGVTVEQAKEITAVVADLSSLEVNHAHERLRIRLRAPANEEVVVILWPTAGCPGPVMAHAHLLFGADTAAAEPPGGPTLLS